MVEVTIAYIFFWLIEVVIGITVLGVIVFLAVAAMAFMVEGMAFSIKQCLRNIKDEE